MATSRKVAHFALLERLGAGGMGVVYRARDEKLGREVALKVIHEDKLEDPEFRRRLLREARAAAAVTHPGVATVFEIGEDAGCLYIAMELVRGRTLRQVMGGEALPLERALSLGAQIAAALGKAHGAGIVHRDIKPENVLVTEQGDAKVLDFGIARRYADNEPASGEAATEVGLSTREGAVIGTPGYLSPEQARGVEVGPASDIFSLGVLLYELLSGARPFGGATVLEAAVAVIRDQPAPLAERAALPLEVSALVQRCLEKDPSKRPSDVRELGARLQQLAEQTVRGSNAPTARGTSFVVPPTGTPARVRVGRRSVTVGVGLVVALAVALAIARALSLPAPAAAPSGSSPRAVAKPLAITDLPITGTSNPAARTAYQEALAGFRRADWRRAAVHLREAVAKDEGFVLAQLRLAHVEATSGDLTEARRRFRWVSEREEALDERHRAWLRAVEAMDVHDPADYPRASELFATACRRWPNDAEFEFMLAGTYQAMLKLDEAIEHARTALRIDPSYGDALQTLARALVDRDEPTEAEAFFDRCVEGRSLDCLHDRLRLKADEGRCDEVVADAKLIETSGGRGSLHWVHAASAVLSQGESMEAAEPFLKRAEEQADNAWSREYARRARLQTSILFGRFDEIPSSFGRADGRVANLDELQVETEIGALVRLEAGEQREFIDLAERFLSARHAAPSGMVGLPTRDPSPLLWRELALAGRIGSDELTERLARWQSRARERGFGERVVWFKAEVVPARTAEEARQAVAHRPERFTAAQVRDHTLVWDELGRVYMMSGDLDEARRALTTATKSCTLLLYPVSHLHAWQTLGEVTEALHDDKAACAAYGRVLRYWGKARPRSRTAELARTRFSALRCTP